jgi:hypothetical protein
MMGATRATPALDEIEVAVLASVAAKVVPELAAVTAPDNCAAGPAPALLPEQMLPAGHAEHVVRWLVSVPPLVNEPCGHMLQTAATAAEYLKSESHARHSCVPPSAAVPAGQGTTMLVPEHACPAAHGVQAVRRAASFPVVCEPAAQVLQRAAPFGENFSSVPHTSQVSLPASAAVPAAHSICTLEPEHLEPAGHCEHVVRWLASLPLVKEPAPQVLHVAAPLEECLLSAPHASHVSLPASAAVPAEHSVCVLPP